MDWQSLLSPIRAWRRRGLAEAAIQDGETRFRTVYDTAPVGIWQEDWTEVIQAIEGLRARGVSDFAAYFDDHPEFVADMLQAVKILDVNQLTVQMFEARHKTDLLASLGTIFATADTLPGFVAELTALATGQQVFRTEMTVNTVRGNNRHILLAMSFPPPGSDTGRVLVSTIDITERREAEARLHETQRLSEALNRINETLHASLDSSEIMKRLVSEGAAALGCETAAISLRWNGRWVVTHVHGFPEDLIGAQMNDDEERHAMLALRSRQPVAIADALNDERVDCEHMRKHNIRAVLVAPLIERDEPFGALFFNYHTAPQPFSEAQVHFATQLATTAAIALENGRLFEESGQAEAKIRYQNAVLRAVNGILGAALTAATEKDLGHACMAVIQEITGSELAFIGEADADGLLRPIAISRGAVDAGPTCDSTGSGPAALNFPPHGFFGRVLLDGVGLFTNDPSSHPDWIEPPPGHPPLTSFLGVPLIRDNQTIGMIAVGNRAVGYRYEQLAALEALAPVVVEAFLRKRAEAAAEEGKQILDALMDSVPEGITIANAPDAEIRLVSRHGQELLGSPHAGLTAGQVAGQWQVYKPDGVTPIADEDLPLVRAIQQGETVRDVEIVQAGAAGQRLLLSCNAAPIRDREGKITGGVVAWRDVSELKEAERRYSRILASALNGFCITDMQGGFREVNDALCRMLGYSRVELLTMRIHDIEVNETPSDVQSRLSTLRERGFERFESRNRRRDGTIIDVEVGATYLESGGGQIVVFVQDITERKGRSKELKRLNRTLTAQSHSNQALLHAATEATYMQEVCRIIVEDCGHAMVWIGFAQDDEEKTVRPVAYAGFEEGYLETLGITWADTERGRGPTGTAIRTAKPSFCRNMLTDPQFAPWREEALRRGYASSLVLPLLDNDRALGALTIYFREPDPFTESEIALLAGLADDLAYGIRTIRLREAHARAEEALRQSEERYRHLFNSMTEGFSLHEILCDAEGKPYDYRYLEVNPAFEKLTGLKRESLLGQTALEVLPGLEPFWIETYGRVALTGEPAHFEYHTDALGRHYEVFAFRPAEGQFASLFLDVSARREAEEALRQAHDELELRVQERTAELQASEERFRQLAQAVHEVFWMLEPDTRRILYVSPAYETIWGRSLQALYRQPDSFLDSVHPDDRQELLRWFTPNWQAYDGEFRILRPDGSPRWVRLRSFPILDEQGAVYRLAGVATDVTEQKAAEAALIQAERLAVAGRMAASLVHEINNPLQAVIGCLGLAKGALGSKDPAPYLHIAYEEVQRTARIVSQLRALSRPIPDAEKEPTDLNSLLADVLALNRNQLDAKKIETVWEPDPDLAPLPLMPDPMHQVFLNLVLNAMDAMPGGGRLRVSTARSESPAGVQVAFADTGAGISAQDLPHLFEAFYSTKPEGLGMGLFVSQNIVAQHNGRIDVESELGGGTTFTVWLPAS